MDAPIPVPPKADPDVIAADLQKRMGELLHEVQESYPSRPAGDTDNWWLPSRLGGTAPTPEEAAALDHAEALARKKARE
jgi:hypothetical protein